MIQPVIVGAPVGNYFIKYWLANHITPTAGSFTLENRGGLAYRLWRCIRTLRPHPTLGGCTNKLNLPNPGLGAALLTPERTENSIISVSARRTVDWQALFYMLQGTMCAGVELNISCPNRDEIDESNYKTVFKNAVATITWCPVIVKFPPVMYERAVCTAYDAGVRWFHGCNTIPTPAGGLSGRVLRPFVLQFIEYVRIVTQHDRDVVHILAGGGSKNLHDAMEYRKHGANHVVFTSALLNPFNWPAVKHAAHALQPNK